MAEIIRQCDAGHLSLNAENWECPWCENARLERLQQHMVINELKIEEQTREIELLHSALNNLARQRDVAEQQVERLRARINKALKAAPKDPDRAALCNLPGYIRAMVRALKGGEK